MPKNKKPTLICIRMGKIAMKKKITNELVRFKYNKVFLIYENISLTFSKKDLSLFSGCGIKLSSVNDFSKN